MKSKLAITRELKRVEKLFQHADKHGPPNDREFLYGARQALLWVMEMNAGAASTCIVISKKK